ncbi:MAG: hypothetical protein Q8N36_05460 [bacterium]|nr:hypothetical protein [bacterium]
MTQIKGTLFAFYTTITVALIVLGVLWAAKSGKFVPHIRRIAGLDAIEEAIGRATEMGRPIHYTMGHGPLTTSDSPQTFASFSVLTYVTGLAAKYNAELIVTMMSPQAFPLVQELVRTAFMAAGKADMFHEDSVRFLSEAQFAYAAGVIGIFHRDKVAANLMFGYFMAESLLFAEAASQAGAIQIAGTGSMAQTPFFVAACDYTLLGEELYASGAYLSKDVIKLGSIAGQDVVKLATMVFILSGAVLATLANPWLVNLMKK